MTDLAMGFAGVILLFVVAAIVGVTKQRRRAARWSQRAHENDPTFLKECEIPEEAFESRIVLTARRTLGVVKGVPPETIHADDAVRGDLEKITDDWECLDWMDMIYRLQRELHVTVDQHRLWALASESAYVSDRSIQICDVMQALIETVRAK